MHNDFILTTTGCVPYVVINSLFKLFAIEKENKKTIWELYNNGVNDNRSLSLSKWLFELCWILENLFMNFLTFSYLLVVNFSAYPQPHSFIRSSLSLFFNTQSMHIRWSHFSTTQSVTGEHFIEKHYTNCKKLKQNKDIFTKSF